LFFLKERRRGVMAGGRRIVLLETILNEQRKNCRCRNCGFCTWQFNEKGEFDESGCRKCYYVGTPCAMSLFKCCDKAIAA
jgi:hypothetical protein